MPRFEVLPRPVQKFGSRFLLHAPPCSASGTTTSGTRASPKPGTHLKCEKVRCRPNGCSSIIMKVYLSSMHKKVTLEFFEAYKDVRRQNKAKHVVIRMTEEMKVLEID